MQFEPLYPGKYIVAVSGGVDSMVLLHLLHLRGDLQLVVAHFEHGIRADSDQDRQLVEQAAASYSLPFIYERGHLGAGASESTARDARYAFLERIKATQGAQAIVTAHHQDDLLETALINLLRGTGRKGLSSLRSTTALVRPLLHATKQQIYDYARHNNIVWREDSTNSDESYLRNHVRNTLLPRLSQAEQATLLGYVARAMHLNPLIDDLLLADIAAHTRHGSIQRPWFIMLPYDVSCEVMAAWLRQHGIRTFDRRTIGRLVVMAKTAKAGKRGDIVTGYSLDVGKTLLSIVRLTAS